MTSPSDPLGPPWEGRLHEHNRNPGFCQGLSNPGSKSEQSWRRVRRLP